MSLGLQGGQLRAYDPQQVQRFRQRLRRRQVRLHGRSVPSRPRRVKPGAPAAYSVLRGLNAYVESMQRLQAATAAELDCLLPSILDKALNGEL